jgi:hypothetical protein
LRFTAQLGSARTPVQVDVGFGDVTTPEPLLTDIPVLLDHPAPRLRAYARESAIAEKLHAMVELGLANSRMKDYYDVWFLSKFYSFDAEVLCRALRATFERRRTAVPSSEPIGLSAEFASDAVKLTQWKAFLRRSRLAEEAPLFPDLITEVRRFLMPILQAANAAGAPAARWLGSGSWVSQ